MWDDMMAELVEVKNSVDWVKSSMDCLRSVCCALLFLVLFELVAICVLLRVVLH